MTQLRGRLVRGGVWLTAARFSTNIISLLTTFVLARLLSPDDFGIVALGLTVQGIVSAFTLLPLSDAIVQHKNPEHSHYYTAFSLALLRGLFLFIAILLMSIPTYIVSRDERVIYVLATVALCTLLSGLNNPRLAILTRNLLFWQQFPLQVGGKIASLIVSVTVAIIFKNFWALLSGLIVGQLVETILSYAVVPYRPRFDLSKMRDLISFSAWVTLGNAVNGLGANIDQLLIAGSLGTQALGHYSIGNRLASAPTQDLLAPLSATVFPALASVAHDATRLSTTYQRMQALVTLVALPLGVGVALTSEILVRLLLGEKWLSAVPIIQVLSGVFAMQTLGNFAEALALATGKTRLIFWRNLQIFMLRTPIIIAGTLTLGLMGLLYARIFSGLLAILWNIVLVRKLIGISLMRQISSNYRSILGTLIMSLAIIILQNFLPVVSGTSTLNLSLHLMLCAVCGFTVYFGSIFVLWSLQKGPQGPELEGFNLIKGLLFRRRK